MINDLLDFPYRRSGKQETYLSNYSLRNSAFWVSIWNHKYCGFVTRKVWILQSSMKPLASSTTQKYILSTPRQPLISRPLGEEFKRVRLYRQIHSRLNLIPQTEYRIMTKEQRIDLFAKWTLCDPRKQYDIIIDYLDSGGSISCLDEFLNFIAKKIETKRAHGKVDRHKAPSLPASL